jgi:hypothetical protein
MKKQNRRGFLTRSAALTGGAALAAGNSPSALSYSRTDGANERIRLGVIGCGGRGRGNLGWSHRLWLRTVRPACPKFRERRGWTLPERSACSNERRKRLGINRQLAGGGIVSDQSQQVGGRTRPGRTRVCPNVRKADHTLHGQPHDALLRIGNHQPVGCKVSVQEQYPPLIGTGQSPIHLPCQRDEARSHLAADVSFRRRHGRSGFGNHNRLTPGGVHPEFAVFEVPRDCDSEQDHNGQQRQAATERTRSRQAPPPGPAGNMSWCDVHGMRPFVGACAKFNAPGDNGSR